MKKIGITCCLIIALLLGCAMPFSAGAKTVGVRTSANEETRVIKVGYPIQNGLTMKDENGNYYGYMYDYLMELSQYTGWKYEFVEIDDPDINVQLTQLIDMLGKGEIDMLGAMVYNESLAKVYDYPTDGYGNAYSVLAVKKDNDRLDSTTLSTVKNVRVALLKSAKARNEKLDQYALANGLKLEKQYYDDEEGCNKAINEGKADAILSVDIGLNEGYRTIARFSPEPMYFAVTKGKSAIVKELNQGMEELNQINPTLMQSLYTKYFDQKSEHVILTQQEKTYVENSPELKVLVLDKQAPIQYEKDGNASGAAVDILNAIKEETGLRFTYEIAETYEEYQKKLQNKEIDLLAAVNYDYSLEAVDSLNVSNVYLSVPLQMVLKKNTEMNHLEGKKLAICRELSSVLKDRIEEDQVLYCESTEECLKAVESGKADYCMDSSYAISYYMNQGSYNSLISVNDVKGAVLNYSFGLSTNDDHMLTGILNKCIRNLSEEDINTYIYEHSLDSKVTLRQYVQQHAMESILFAVVIIIGLIAFFSYFYRRQAKMKRQIEIENGRYRMLGEITQEIIFEYDYEKDILKMGDKENMFGQNDEFLNYAQQVSQDHKDRTFSLLSCIMEKKDADRDVQLYLANGECRWFHIVMKVVYDVNKPVYAIGRALDIQEERMEREKLEKESTFDALTGLYNAASIKKLVQKNLMKNPNSVSLGILDLDNFKEVNDEYGHYIGDQVLSAYAATMQGAFGDDSMIGRLGGDEFIIFFPHGERKEQLEEYCRNMQNLLKEVKQDIPPATVSIGFVQAKGIEDFNILYQEADKILYEVKNNGRNGYLVKTFDEASQDK